MAPGWSSPGALAAQPMCYQRPERITRDRLIHQSNRCHFYGTHTR